MVAQLVALAALFLAAAAETLHAQRVARAARLAFGPDARPRAWVRVAGPARALAAAAIAWGLVTLMLLPPKVHRAEEEVPDELKGHIVLVLDVSPSMRLVDAGPDLKQNRLQRVKVLMDSLLARVPIERYRVSVVAFYNGAKVVVADTKDMEVVRNILDDLPMHYAFFPGKTRLADGLAEAARLAHPWNPRSTTVIVMTDGDTIASEVPRLPASVSDVLVVGVGDPRVGKFIEGRHSRQDPTTLRRIAARLGGEYHDGNQKHVPTALLDSLVMRVSGGPLEKLTAREYALLAVALGAATLGLLPVALWMAGSPWAPGLPARQRAVERSVA